MTTRSGNRRSFPAVVLLATILGGCVPGSLQEFDRTIQISDQHRLYEPLAATPQGILERLAEIDLEPATVFHLSSMGAEPYTDPLTPELYWNEDKAVFFKIENGDDEENPWLYFNGHKLRIETIQDPLARDGDLAPAAEGAFSLYRSVPVRKGGARLTADLELFRYDFRVTPEGDLETVGYQRITRAKGADYQAVPIVTTERIVYIHHEKNGPHRLMVGDIYGGPPRPLFVDQDFDALFPAMLSDGRLVFVADLLGHHSLFQVENASEYVRELETLRANHQETKGAFVFSEIARPFVYPFPRSEHEGNMLLASVSEDGRPRPVLQILPDRFDLAAVADQVRAHNPAVNERRARYATAMLDAAQFKLNNWPRLDLGLSYDDAISLFDNIPAVFTGDTVTKQILRVFAGLSQPLLDFRENNARTESALRDAALMNDLLDKEINDRTTEAAALYFEAVYLAQRIDIETEQLAVTDKRMAYYRSLREKLEAMRLQIMATEQVRQGILSERGFDQERLAFVQTRLKEVMGLPLATDIDLAYDVRYDFDRYVLPPLEEAVHLAQLNHPSIKATENALASAFWQQTAGPAIRPRASASAGYEHRNREFQRDAFSPAQAALVPESTADEIVSFALAGQIPLASVKANRLHNQMWAEI
ncbi:MAG: TolC family protein, partial [Candidatus Hydrogenedentes bacterium]|nr:TolC family protein [Candidatus Hydrogenedentota bacterium]